MENKTEYTREQKQQHFINKQKQEIASLKVAMCGFKALQEKYENLIAENLRLQIDMRNNKAKAQAAYNEVQNQITHNKQKMKIIQRKSRENNILNEIMYRFMRDNGIEFDYKASRLDAHKKALAEEIKEVEDEERC